MAAPIVYAHYYGWYTTDQWSQATTDDPLLGLYSSQDNAVVAQHIEWGRRAGMTALSVSWHGEGSPTDTQLKKHLKLAIESQLAADNAVKFMILFETPDILGVAHGNVIDFGAELSPGVSRGAKFLQEMNYLADSYFGSAGYYKIDQKPVAFIYLMRDVVNHQPYFDTLRSNMESKGFSLYLIADVIHWQNPVDGLTVPDSQVADWDFYKTHFEAISGYNLYDPSRYRTNGLEDKFLADVEAHWRTWASHISAHGLRFVPFVMPGYDDRRLHGSTRPILKRDGGRFYNRQWAMAQSFMDSTMPHVGLTSFNEWHEGTEIEPSRQYGVSYLDITREFTHGRESARETSRVYGKTSRGSER